jgi:hypothetical protein
MPGKGGNRFRNLFVAAMAFVQAGCVTTLNVAARADMLELAGGDFPLVYKCKSVPRFVPGEAENNVSIPAEFGSGAGFDMKYERSRFLSQIINHTNNTLHKRGIEQSNNRLVIQVNKLTYWDMTDTLSSKLAVNAVLNAVFVNDEGKVLLNRNYASGLIQGERFPSYFGVNESYNNKYANLIYQSMLVSVSCILKDLSLIVCGNGTEVSCREYRNHGHKGQLKPDSENNCFE